MAQKTNSPESSDKAIKLKQILTDVALDEYSAACQATIQAESKLGLCKNSETKGTNLTDHDEKG